MVSSFLALVLLFAYVNGEPAHQCRASEERYLVSDKQQCDKFYMCNEEGELEAEFLCEDGLMFDVISKQCGLPHGIDCTTKPLQQEPQPRGNCLRLNGKWAVAGTCDSYTDCTSGVERAVTCQNHLVYDLKTGQCEHPDTAHRDGCTAEELYQFVCPADLGFGQGRYAAQGDCRAFFTCAVYTNYHPRLSGCSVGTVFNEEKQICDEPVNVPRCKDYYKDEAGSNLVHN